MFGRLERRKGRWMNTNGTAVNHGRHKGARASGYFLARCGTLARRTQLSNAVLSSALLLPGVDGRRLLGHRWLVRGGFPEHRRPSVLD